MKVRAILNEILASATEIKCCNCARKGKEIALCARPDSRSVNDVAISAANAALTGINCTRNEVDYWSQWRRSHTRNPPPWQWCPPAFRAGQRFCPKTAIIRNIENHERVLPREGSFRPALDRHAVQLPRHARYRLPLPERPVRDDRPRGRWPSAAARLQHGQRQSRGRARVLLDQGAGRSADLAPAEDQGRRHHPGRPQGDRHADHRQPHPRQAADAALDRHRPRAVRQPDQGPRGLRPVRQHRAGARLPPGLRARLWREAGRELARGRAVRRAARGQADLLSDRDPRAVPQPRPHHRPHQLRADLQRHRPGPARHRDRPRHDVRQPGDARRAEGDVRRPRFHRGLPATSPAIS